MSEKNMNEIRDAASATAPSPHKLTLQHVEATVASQQFLLVDGGRMTICVLTLRNGFQVTGQSACVDLANFNQQKGESVARENALNRVWELEGYLLRERMMQEQRASLQFAEMAKLTSGMAGAENYQEAYIVGMVDQDKRNVIGPYLILHTDLMEIEGHCPYSWTLDIDEATLMADYEAQEQVTRLMPLIDQANVLGVRKVYRFLNWDPKHPEKLVRTDLDGSQAEISVGTAGEVHFTGHNQLDPQLDAYAQMAEVMSKTPQAESGERKVGMAPELGMPYGQRPVAGNEPGVHYGRCPHTTAENSACMQCREKYGVNFDWRKADPVPPEAEKIDHVIIRIRHSHMSWTFWCCYEDPEELGGSVRHMWSSGLEEAGRFFSREEAEARIKEWFVRRDDFTYAAMPVDPRQNDYNTWIKRGYELHKQYFGSEVGKLIWNLEFGSKLSNDHQWDSFPEAK